MVASNQTINEILDVLVKHLDTRTIIEILTDLEEIPGNKSYKETIALLIEKARLRGILR